MGSSYDGPGRVFTSTCASSKSTWGCVRERKHIIFQQALNSIVVKVVTRIREKLYKSKI